MNIFFTCTAHHRSRHPLPLAPPLRSQKFAALTPGNGGNVARGKGCRTAAAAPGIALRQPGVTARGLGERCKVPLRLQEIRRIEVNLPTLGRDDFDYLKQGSASRGFDDHLPAVGAAQALVE